LTQIKNQILVYQNSTKNIILGGDFNLPNITWEIMAVTPGKTNRHTPDLLRNNHSLKNIQTEPTMHENIMSNKQPFPSLLKSVQVIPGISDHHIVLVDQDIQPSISKPKPRKVLLYKNVNWDHVKNSAAQLS